MVGDIPMGDMMRTGEASFAIGDEHDEGDVGHDPYGGTARMNEW